MSSIHAFLHRLAQDGLTTAEYTSIAFFVLTALLLLYTYVVTRQKWAEIGAWASLGTIAVAIHFMVVGWRETAPAFVGSMPLMATSKSEGIGRRIKDCAHCPELVVIEPGYFIMGADDAEAGAEEGPLRRMMIGRRFAISRSVTTADELAAYAAASGRPASACGGAAACFTWHDAQSYVRWLSGMTGRAYRLPSAAEWEYVARAGKAAPAMAEAGSIVRVSHAQAGAVAAPNAFGVAGLAEGVGEIVDDCWSPTLAALRSDGQALLPPTGYGCRHRVLKYVAGGAALRFSGRRPWSPDARLRDAGFRVVREVSAQ